MTISREELEARTGRLRHSMQAEGLDALVIYSDEYRSGHGTYLTNYKPINVIEESPQLILLVEDQPPVLLLGRLNAYAARDVIWFDDVRGIHRAAEHIPEILQPIAGRSSHVGVIEGNILPVTYFDHIQAALPQAHFESRDDLMIELRQIKSEAELALMARAAAVNDAVLREVLQHARVGMTEIQIAGLAESAAREIGADFGSATVVMSGPNTSYPAWRPSERRIEPGDFVMVDFNPAVEHYCNDGGITLLMPGGDPEQERAITECHRIMQQVVPLIRPHVSAASVYELLVERLEPLGFAEHFTPYVGGQRGVGHGVGLDVVEPPNLSSRSDFTLLPGMALAIKLDLHGLPAGGLRVEVVVAITEDGVRPLNRLVLDEPADVAILR